MPWRTGYKHEGRRKIGQGEWEGVVRDQASSMVGEGRREEKRIGEKRRARETWRKSRRDVDAAGLVVVWRTKQLRSAGFSDQP